MFVFDVEKEADKAGATHANSANHANPDWGTAPISTISTTTPTNLAECRAELVSLVNRVADHHGFTPEQRQEALEIALSDPTAALECFRALAVSMSIPDAAETRR